MQVYLVGGAVRDAQLGLPVAERDWCVVGSTPDDMLALNYRPVGKDFPVFLHPETGEEYALARTERKTAAGYHGFSFNTSPDVSIEDDLKRRDLTINALAQDEDGQLIDPYGGLDDLRDRTLRHISSSFSEDPVRVLRVARFAARFHHLGFRVADETLGLMRDMVKNGEVDALVPDRVWKETESALCGRDCRVFFEVLRDCGALAVIFPEVDRLFGVPQTKEWHPEIDSGLHTMMVLDQAERLSVDGDVRFAALVHDLGKGTTRAEDLPSHPGHEQRGSRLVDEMAERFPIPKAYRELGKLVANYHLHCHRAFELRADTVLRVIEAADAFRRPERFEKFLVTCEADARGRKGLEDRDYPQVDYFRRAFAAASNVDAAAIASQGASEDIPARIRRARVDAIAPIRDEVRRARKG
ncbi:MAG: multifunctional CCA addition/repair protein [Woeseiaceae bacterium]|nr:multifunctional CCA addition/repair protein [Woeseiaceae bacterium]